jgi:hypothetical protein
MKKVTFAAAAAALCTFLAAPRASAQDDLMNLLNADSAKMTRPVSATFKGTRLINGHSVETVRGQSLDFLIQHRFGRLNSGAENFFGLDEAIIRLGLEYGVSNRLTIGVGRSSNQKTVDVFAKYRVLRQTTGAKRVPVSITLFASDAIVTEPTLANASGTEYFSNRERQNYTFQAIIARKFSERFSLQLMPTALKVGKVPTGGDEWVTALGVGGRVKISKRVALVGEYYVVPDDQRRPYGSYNALALGFDIETGGHVFQLHFTNARGMIEKQFLTNTTGRWGKGDVHYGFNISRTFSFDKKARQPKTW